MGKRIISQRRGQAGPRFLSPSHRYAGEISAKHLTDDKIHFGKVVELVHSTGHTAPLMRVQYDDGEVVLLPAFERVAVGDVISVGKTTTINQGNTLPLASIPEGTFVYNLESTPGDGGKFVRSAGIFAKVVSKLGKTVTVQLPSKKERTFSDQCRATIGSIAGGGRMEKPLMKAGARWHNRRARGKLYPVVSAVAMNAMEHPFGSGRGRHMGKPSIAPRHAPPGRKVGQVRARRTGYKR
ncbi:50S ribosomal protein L2 [Candidatus Woesearchaeota archaeon]|nr:50S ribosomal protein L2 [Candidatus Woesearchaeota archaeon]